MAAEGVDRQVQYRKAAELFQAVCELPIDGRDAHLSRACGADLELRKEVESLLEHHQPTTVRGGTSTSRPGARRDPLRILRGTGGILAAGLTSLALLAGLRAWTVEGTERSLLEARIRELRSVIDGRVSALQAWRERQIERFRSVAGFPELIRHSKDLLRLAEASPELSKDLAASAAHRSLKEFLARLPKDLAGVGFVVMSPAGIVLSSEEDRLVGQEGTAASGEMIRRALLGEILVAKPYRHRTYITQASSDLQAPILLVGGQIRDETGKALAILALMFESSQGFAPHFGRASHGRTSELFAFDDKGVLLTDLPDPDRQAKLGLAPQGLTALKLRLRDPGGDLAAGFMPATPADDWPMTRLCLTAFSKKSGEDATGYRNVRGREVVGAWTWLPAWDMGVGVELERAEALLPAGRVRLLFDVLFAAVGLGTLGLLAFGRRFGVYRRTSEQGTAGSYVLDRRIGSGGMAEVHLAHHSHLKRPTAVKILNGRGADSQAAARFDREAKLASRLSHPNTVQIYDYGRTRDGRFYLAMEYLEGLNLAQLVALGGPLEPARAIHLLDQVCGSLEEAHAAGLVHRDIKPANVMVCRRGGIFDVVKVLDFGIARSLNEGTAELTLPHQIAGTPLYIAPERIRSPQHADPRSDLYSLGALSYFLLTGRNVFEGSGPAEILYQALSVDPLPPSRLRGAPLPPDLEKLVLDLLSREPALRPASAAAVRDILSSLEIPERWDQGDARAWWTDHSTRIARLTDASAPRNEPPAQNASPTPK